MTDADLETCIACKRPLADCECSEEMLLEAASRLEKNQPEIVRADDAGQQARRSKAADRAEKQSSDDLNWLMRHPQGRRFMWRLLGVCGVYRSAYVAGAGETNAVFFALGETNVGLNYLNQVVASEPDNYALMVRENSGSKTA